MKKFTSLLLLLISCSALVGCSPVAAVSKNGNVKEIHVTSEPQGYEYSFTGNEAQAIAEYLSNLNLTPAFPFHSYTGGSWNISIEYENGKIINIYHSCNKFIRINNGMLYEMPDEEGRRFDTLLDELSN